MRLDRFLAEAGVGTRSAVNRCIKKLHVTVNGELVGDPAFRVDENNDSVCFDGRPVMYEEFSYYMLNKPQGVVTATRDSRSPTVLDLIEGGRRRGLFPVGRLDKDTEGLLLITNDGELAHRLLSPSKHVDKKYLACVCGTVDDYDIGRFRDGLDIGGEYMTRPAKLEVVGGCSRENQVCRICGCPEEEACAGDNVSQVYVTLQEGRFHQIKRMFEALGKRVLYLKRVSMGTLVLDGELERGSYRPLTEEEVRRLKQ